MSSIHFKLDVEFVSERWYRCVRCTFEQAAYPEETALEHFFRFRISSYTYNNRLDIVLSESFTSAALAMDKGSHIEKGVEVVLDELEARSIDSYDHTQRKLKSRHIQLMAIGGTIGTALFVQIGQALTEGGPASLFIAFTIWSTFILAINNCLAEMVTWIPISSPFVRFADHFVDPALGFCAGINFFIFEASLIPFEVTAFNIVLQFWTDKIPLIAVIFFVLLCYLALNLWTVRYFGG
jgi:yeast amino acid transporter